MVSLSPYRNLHSIEMIRHIVRQWWRLELAFADANGYVLDHADGEIRPSDNDFCRRALFAKEGLKRCNDSVKVVRDKVRDKPGEILVHQCHMGFDIVAAPIHLGGELAGFLFTGGALHAEPTAATRADLLRKVREIGAPVLSGKGAPRRKRVRTEDAGLDVGAVPRFSETDLQYLRDLLRYGAEQVMACHTSRAASVTPERDVGARFVEIVGDAPVMRDVYRLLDKIVRSESTVLVHGESGTGKELIARAIHYHGPRAERAFVVQNCSAFNDNLLESALFGHVRGAFTGAVNNQKGLFEVADGGTFFLDEIGDMSAALQVKLLRVLQEGTLTPVGATKPVHVDVRIIAASHKDLARMVERGEFREDLFYRVNVLKVTVPPLRDRLEDLETLAGYFLRKHHRGDGPPTRLSASALDAMRRYRWPGNIRELENEIERLLVLGADRDEIDASLLSRRILDAVETAPEAAVAARVADHTGTLREVVERVEAEVIGQGLIRTHWNKSQLAKELGISRSNLIQKCNYYGLDRKG